MTSFAFDPIRRWQDLKAAITPALAPIAAGALVAGRDRAMAALRSVGIPTSDTILSEAELGTLERHWLIVYGCGSSGDAIVAAIPDSAFSEAERVELGRRWSVAVAPGETSCDAPEQWALWARFTISIGYSDPQSFSPDLALRAESGIDNPSARELDAWQGQWEDRVAAASGMRADVRKLDVPLAGVLLLHESA